MILPFLLAIGLSYFTSKVYKKYTTPQQKRTWENFIKVHHGEAGIVMVGAGALTKSPNLIASGVGLILHDRNDYKKWFTGNKK